MSARICLFVLMSWLSVIVSCAGQPVPFDRSQKVERSPIRTVMFDKLSYANFPDYTSDTRKRLTLSRGELSPSFLTYGDMTGDGVEDAAVAIGISIRGSAIPDYVYIYTVVDGSPTPKALWDFETGDRADGGLRNVYGENGQLVIELFGKDRIIGDQLYRGDEPLCCPSSFTKTIYHWNGTSFQRIRSEVVPNPTQDAAPVMTIYRESPKR